MKNKIKSSFTTNKGNQEWNDYTVAGLRIIGDYEFGYVKTSHDQVFLAISDGWEPICGVGGGRVGARYVLVKRLNKKEKTIKELKQELKEAKKLVKDLTFQIKNIECSRFDLMDLGETE